MLQELSFYDRERAYPPSVKINVFIFLVEKGKKFLGCQTLSQISSSNLKVSNGERVGVVNPGMVIYLCQLGWEKTGYRRVPIRSTLLQLPCQQLTKQTE